MLILLIYVVIAISLWSFFRQRLILTITKDKNTNTHSLSKEDWKVINMANGISMIFWPVFITIYVCSILKLIVRKYK